MKNPHRKISLAELTKICYTCLPHENSWPKFEELKDRKVQENIRPHIRVLASTLGLQIKVITEEDKEDILDAAIRRTKEITFCACKRRSGHKTLPQKFQGYVISVV